MRSSYFLLLLAACTANKDADDTPKNGESESLRVPAEWEPQQAVWLQWPRRYEQADEPDFAKIVAALIHAEDVHLLVNDDPTRAAAQLSLEADGGLSQDIIAGGLSAEGFQIVWHPIANDSAWMRDNGPVYVVKEGEVHIQDWQFDAWGGAFGNNIAYQADDAVPTQLGTLLDLPVDPVDLVHERGNLEFNGVDTVVLNWTVLGNRNPGLSRSDAMTVLKANFGVSRVVMIEGAPKGDLTGGHIDGIARFIDAERIVVPDCATASACQPGDHDDQIYDAAAEQLTAAGLTVLRWPFQTKVRFRGIDLDTDYMNWLVTNTIVVTISFGDVEADAAAKAQLEEWFPDREVVLLPILQSWYDGGGVHCHTNDQPKP